MLTEHVYNIQPKSYNISLHLNGEIGEKEILNNAFTNHYLLHRSCRKKRQKKKAREGHE
jgi:hypothetical protein